MFVKLEFVDSQLVVVIDNVNEIDINIDDVIEVESVIEDIVVVEFVKFYIVQFKENFYWLLLKYNIKFDILKVWNNFDNNGFIKIGMKLWLVLLVEQIQ